MNHLKNSEEYWFQSNKYHISKRSCVYACISSRITTVIQVVRDYQINYNWYNEPFAVSLYKSFILRHAWLNLWDERMTTGRINQVAILGVVRVIGNGRRSDRERSLRLPTNHTKSFHKEITNSRSDWFAIFCGFQKPFIKHLVASKHEHIGKRYYFNRTEIRTCRSMEHGALDGPDVSVVTVNH